MKILKSQLIFESAQPISASSNKNILYQYSKIISEICNMKFSTGDIVRLKNTGEEGRIVSLLSADMAEVEVGATVFPVFIDEIEHPYLEWFLKKNKKETSTKKMDIDDWINADAHQKTTPVHKGFQLSFLPEFKFDIFDEVVDKLRIYFVNETAYRITLQYECLGKAACIFQIRTTILPFAHFYLHDLPFEEMQDQPRFVWQLDQQENASLQSSTTGILKIKPKKLFEYLAQLKLENEPLFNIRLIDDFPVKNQKGSQQVDVQNTSIPFKEPKVLTVHEQPEYEIDLHIEQLVSSRKGMTNFDMLSLQLNTLEQALDKAIRLHQRTLVVIHGIGSGRLKSDIHQLLESHSGVSHYHHGWMPKYGYGATEVFF